MAAGVRASDAERVPLRGCRLHNLTGAHLDALCMPVLERRARCRSARSTTDRSGTRRCCACRRCPASGSCLARCGRRSPTRSCTATPSRCASTRWSRRRGCPCRPDPRRRVAPHQAGQARAAGGVAPHLVHVPRPARDGVAVRGRAPSLVLVLPPRPHDRALRRPAMDSVDVVVIGAAPWVPRRRGGWRGSAQTWCSWSASSRATRRVEPRRLAQLPLRLPGPLVRAPRAGGAPALARAGGRRGIPLLDVTGGRSTTATRVASCRSRPPWIRAASSTTGCWPTRRRNGGRACTSRAPCCSIPAVDDAAGCRHAAGLAAAGCRHGAAVHFGAGAATVQLVDGGDGVEVRAPRLI